MSEPLRLFVGTGTEGLRPAGYKTIDIDPEHRPDIVADAASLPMIETGTADEFYASHVLEHFSWPRALVVLQEWARVLRIGGIIKIAVPDMGVYAHFLLNGGDPFNVMNDIYGGHWVAEGGPQGHHFGYTRRMLVEVLAVMGFGSFDTWRSELPEAANTWKFGENQERVGISLNVSGVKEREPLMDMTKLAHRIRYHDVRESFMVLVRSLLVDKAQLTGIADIDAVLFQKLNYRYLEASNSASHYRSNYEELAAATAATRAKVGFVDRGIAIARRIIRDRTPTKPVNHGSDPLHLPEERQGMASQMLHNALDELRDRSKEAIARLVNTENKVNTILQGFADLGRRVGNASAPRPGSAGPFAEFGGSPDQAFGHVTYAQHGEDLIIANIFALLGIDRPSYLDVGANHPIANSNTALLYAHGSRGIIVEANPAFMPLWQELRSDDHALNLAVGPTAGKLTLYRVDDFSGRNTTRRDVAESFIAEHPEFRVQDELVVTAATLNDIVGDHSAGQWPDFLSLDLEGLDYAVLESADFADDRPTALCVEWRGANGGDESEKLLPLLTKKDFVLIFRTWGNLIAVRRAAAQTLGLGLPPAGV